MLISVMSRRRLDYSHLAGGASQVITLEPALETVGNSVYDYYVGPDEMIELSQGVNAEFLGVRSPP